MKFELEPGAVAEVRRLQRWIRMLTWVVGLAVFVPLADFLGGVDLVGFVRGESWPPAAILSLFFAGLISVVIAFLFGQMAEWTCRHRMARARRTASTERIQQTAEQLTVPGVRRAPVRATASAPSTEPPSSPSHPRPG